MQTTICPNCGKPGSGKFCTDCGTATVPYTPAQRANGKKPFWLILAGAATAVILGAALIFTLIIFPSNTYAEAQRQFNNGLYQKAFATVSKLSLSYKDVSELYPYYDAYADYDSGDYIAAAKKFSRLGRYKDSADMKDECNYLGAESLIKAGNYEEAQGLLESLGGYKKSDDMINDSLYAQAVSIMETDGAKAREIFLSLGNYKDSAQRITDCDYYAAMNLLDAKNYAEAYNAFLALDGYRDSTEMLDECRFRKACDLVDEGDYDGALERFNDMLHYKDSAGKAMEVSYLKGQELFAAKDYGAAYNLFVAAGDHKDAADMQNECRYQRGKELLTQTNWSAAAERFTAIGDYRDSKDLLKEANYQQGKEYYSAKNYTQAKAWFAKAAGYRDADALLKECNAYDVDGIYNSYLAGKGRIEQKKLLDFDNDGVLDLYYITIGEYDEEYYHFCTVRDGKVVELLNLEAYFSGGMYCAYNKNSGEYVVMADQDTGDDIASGVDIDVYTMKNGKLTRVEKLVAEYWYASYDWSTVYFRYYINGNSVTQAEYDKARAKYTTPPDNRYTFGR